MLFLQPCLALALGCTTGPLATAPDHQRDRPDAEGYPCVERKALVVAQDQPGFAIIDADATAPAAPNATVPARINVGAALKIDRSILMSATRPHEATDAPAR